MKPIDFRNANFEALRDGLDESRARVYAAWLHHGPATTRQLAKVSGIDLLNVRPRTTELLQLGLLKTADEIAQPIQNTEGGVAVIAYLTPPPREGAYRAVGLKEWEAWREQQITDQRPLI